MITQAKLKEYQRFGGDADAWAQRQDTSVTSDLTAEDFSLISELAGALVLAHEGMVAPSFVTETEKRLKEAVADQETERALRAMAMGTPVNWGDAVEEEATAPKEETPATRPVAWNSKVKTGLLPALLAVCVVYPLVDHYLSAVLRLGVVSQVLASLSAIAVVQGVVFLIGVFHGKEIAHRLQMRMLGLGIFVVCILQLRAMGNVQINLDLFHDPSFGGRSMVVSWVACRIVEIVLNGLLIGVAIDFIAGNCSRARLLRGLLAGEFILFAGIAILCALQSFIFFDWMTYSRGYVFQKLLHLVPFWAFLVTSPMLALEGIRKRIGMLGGAGSHWQSQASGSSLVTGVNLGGIAVAVFMFGGAAMVLRYMNPLDYNSPSSLMDRLLISPGAVATLVGWHLFHRGFRDRAVARTWLARMVGLAVLAVCFLHLGSLGGGSYHLPLGSSQIFKFRGLAGVLGLVVGLILNLFLILRAVEFISGHTHRVGSFRNLLLLELVLYLVGLAYYWLLLRRTPSHFDLTLSEYYGTKIHYLAAVWALGVTWWMVKTRGKDEPAPSTTDSEKVPVAS